jgi:aspartate carbamoyltransferase catalytic subunit
MHILSSNQFTKVDIDEILKLADQCKWGFSVTPSVLANKVMATLFYEPSTRTRLSFEAAMLKLGGKVISVENARESSSDKKGESLISTLKTVSQYVDVIVLRQSQSNPEMGKINCPIINAGDGVNEHPTQSLLDLYTILTTHKDTNKLKILFTGDLKHSRTIRSLIPLLELYYDTDIIFGNQNHDFHNTKSMYLTTKEEHLPEILPLVDVVYMTRNQTERHNEESSTFKMNPDLVNTMREDAIIMHPLPYTTEIDQRVDDNHRAIYYDQVKNGMYVRMGLLYWLLQGTQIVRKPTCH